MNDGIIFCSPLRVKSSKKKYFTLNLNILRNAHYQVINNAKKSYKEVIAPQFLGLPAFNAITTTYTLYPKTKRLCDLDNVLSVHAKFFQDALVELKKLEDDSYLFINKVVFKMGEVDKENPRVDVSVKRIRS